MRSDEGFSLVEVLMSMFLLGLMALAVLPLAIGATRTSVVNRDVVAATAFAESRVALLRDTYRIDATASTCAGLPATASITAVAAGAGAATAGMTATTTAVCPIGSLVKPVSVPVLVSVTDASGAVLVSVPTTVRVALP